MCFVGMSDDAGDTRLQQCYDEVVADMYMMREIESFVGNAKCHLERTNDQSTAKRIMKRACDAALHCKRQRKKQQQEEIDGVATTTTLAPVLNSAYMRRASRFCSMYDLQDYNDYLHHVPMTVNTVSRVVAEPIPGSGTTLPLDLNKVVALCAGTYFWPVRFCPVQLAFHAIPRTRILLFHTGKIMGIGSKGTTSGRLAIMLAIEKLAREADIHLRVVEFTVKNLVGMVDLGATVNNKGLSDEYKRTSNYNPNLFVGLSWHPYRKKTGICCEVYSTGKINLAGASTHSQLLRQFWKLHPAFMRFSSLSEEKAHNTLQFKQLNNDVEEDLEASAAPVPHEDETNEDVWEGWGGLGKY